MFWIFNFFSLTCFPRVLIALECLFKEEQTNVQGRNCMVSFSLPSNTPIYWLHRFKNCFSSQCLHLRTVIIYRDYLHVFNSNKLFILSFQTWRLTEWKYTLNYHDFFLNLLSLMALFIATSAVAENACILSWWSK